ncbi:MAG: hypothetical protein ACOC5R_04415 [Elusimicrobiota bacterium]
MFQEYFAGVELQTKNEVEEVSLNLPESVIKQVKLEKEDLSNQRYLYATMWNMFFIDSMWYADKDVRKKLAELMPSFLICKFTECPFLKGYFSNEAVYEEIKDNFENKLVLIPILGVKKIYSKIRYYLMGIRQNIFRVDTVNFKLLYRNVIVLDKCVFGKYHKDRNDRLDKWTKDTMRDEYNMDYLIDMIYDKEAIENESIQL